MLNYPDVPQLEGLLFEVDAMFGASESHGALCGMICAQGATDAAQWMLHVLGERESASKSLQQVGKLLMQLHQVTMAQMNDSDVEFDLMLPDDNESLEARIEALGSWCQGYVYGLAAGGVTEDSDLPEDSKELIKDILEISRAGYTVDDEDDSDSGDESVYDEDEAAFMEVSEYVRIGILLIYEELQPLQSSQTVH